MGCTTPLLKSLGLLSNAGFLFVTFALTQSCGVLVTERTPYLPHSIRALG